MSRPDGEQVRFVERQQQGVLVNIEQVFVGSHEQWDLRHGGFGKNHPIIELIVGNEHMPEQPLDKSLRDSFSRGLQVKGLNTPASQTG